MLAVSPGVAKVAVHLRAGLVGKPGKTCLHRCMHEGLIVGARGSHGRTPR